MPSLVGSEMCIRDRYGIGGGRCSGCGQSSGVVNELLVLLCCCEHVLDPSQLEIRDDALDLPGTPSGCRRRSLGVEITSASSARRGVTCWEMWPWLDSNGVTFFVLQYDRGTCCRLQRQQYELLLYTYLVPGTWYVLSPCHTKKMKCLFLPRACLLYTSPSPRD